MEAHREAWTQKRGPIPKGWVVHCMNGDMTDTRIENLACVPRDDVTKIIPPYRERIRNLEKKLRFLMED